MSPATKNYHLRLEYTGLANSFRTVLHDIDQLIAGSEYSGRTLGRDLGSWLGAVNRYVEDENALHIRGKWKEEELTWALKKCGLQFPDSTRRSIG